MTEKSQTTVDEGSPTKVIGMLNRAPTIAFLVGTILGEFTAVEFVLVKAMGLVLRDDDDLKLAHAIFGRVRSVKDRCDILAEAAERSNLGEEEKKKIVEGAKILAELNAQRNEYAHGLYETDIEKGTAWLTTWPLDARRKPHTEELTEEKLKADIEQVRTKRTKVLQSLFGAELKQFGKST